VGASAHLNRIQSQVDDLTAGDLFLVCSDGLSDFVRDVEIQAVLSTRPFAQMCGDLVQLALQRGGHDNITVIAAAVADAAIQRQAA
jgi:serine/threonine protein phosphatase PrpC